MKAGYSIISDLDADPWEYVPYTAYKSATPVAC